MRRSGRLGLVMVAVVAAVLGGGPRVATTPEVGVALAAAASPVPPPCPLCPYDPGVPVRVLSADDIGAVGHAYADSNVARIARIDSLLRAGAFGAASGRDARRTAHLLARLLTLNAYAYMIQFSTRRDTVIEVSETALRPTFELFSDPGIVPIARLRRARMGLGRMCGHYALDEKLQTETVLGGRRLRVRVDDVHIGGAQARVLRMDLPTGLHDVVEVWLAEHVTMDVEFLRRSGPPAPHDAYVLDAIEGAWVHKWGVHKPQAFVFWVTPRDPRRSALPETPLVGVRIYVPRLKLRLPLILPDLGVEDLRAVDLPQPILELRYLAEGRYPGWLQPSQLRGFRGWEGEGPLPPEIRRRFPDL